MHRGSTTIVIHTITIHTILIHTIAIHTIMIHTIPIHTIPIHMIVTHTILIHMIPIISTMTTALHHVANVIIEILRASQEHQALRDLQALLAVRDLLVNQVPRDLMVLMENQVLMVHKEREGHQAILESVSIYQDPPVDLDKKETEEHQERLVPLAKMAIPELLDLKENAANMHHLASPATLVDQEKMEKMVRQEHQEHLVQRDRRAKPLICIRLKIKLKMASNLLKHNSMTVVVELVIHMAANVLLMIMMSHVHHMERLSKVHVAIQVLKDHMVGKVTLVLKVILAHMALLDGLELMVPMENQDPKDHLVTKAVMQPTEIVINAHHTVLPRVTKVLLVKQEILAEMAYLANQVLVVSQVNVFLEILEHLEGMVNQVMME